MNRAALIEASLRMQKGVLSPQGALLVETGERTGRSTHERFVVDHKENHDEIGWNDVNKPIDPQWSEKYFAALTKHLEGSSTYIMNGYVGSFKVKVNSTSPWHIAFAQNMFRETVIESLQQQVPDDLEIQIFHAPEMTTKDLGLDHEYETAIIIDPLHLKVGIVGSEYAGEIKKSAFALCNFLYPKYGIFPMHSSANTTKEGTNSCILFGLSGTGKTTLSADPHRYLVGDDEIIWSAKGLSNLEGGCYAKLINLSERKEPEIFRATNQFGSILENVVFDSQTRKIDFDSAELTENTRASYNLKSLPQVFNQTQEAQPPESIVFLMADAFGALPAVARLSHVQAQYHFISGYTAKVAGTEIGIVEPEATFSACFGAPFMPRPASVYGQLLSDLAEKSKASIWLLNTGWFGGGYGVGQRFPLEVSRALLTAIQSGVLDSAPTKTHPIFGFEVPTEAPSVDSKYLEIPENEKVRELADKFKANAAQVNMPAEIQSQGGPS